MGLPECCDAILSWNGHCCSSFCEYLTDISDQMPMVDSGLMKWLHLLPWNCRNSTQAFSFTSISSFAFLPSIVFSFSLSFCLISPFTCIFPIILFTGIITEVRIWLPVQRLGSYIHKKICPIWWLSEFQLGNKEMITYMNQCSGWFCCRNHV